MRKTTANRWLGVLGTLPLVGMLLTCGGPGQAQPPGKDEKKPAAPADKEPAPADKASLEEMLARALKDNPDIRVAETKLREAEAELNRVRLQVMQKVVAYRQDLEAMTKTVAEAEQRYQTLKKLRAQATVSQEELRGAELTLMRYKAELAKIEGELPYLLGKQPVKQQLHLEMRPLTDLRLQTVYVADFDNDGTVILGGLKVLSGDLADQLRKALDTPVQVQYQSAALEDIVKQLGQTVPGVQFVLPIPPEERITLRFGTPIPLGAVLQAIEDSSRTGIRFVVRDYGILVTNNDRPPAGALSVHNFWKSKPDEKSKTPEK